MNLDKATKNIENYAYFHSINKAELFSWGDTLYVAGHRLESLVDKITLVFFRILKKCHVFKSGAETHDPLVKRSIEIIKAQGHEIRMLAVVLNEQSLMQEWEVSDKFSSQQSLETTFSNLKSYCQGILRSGFIVRRMLYLNY